MIGFSVDYVVHLANHYVESPQLTRFKKTQESLREIGISVVSGAVTTSGAAAFLLFGQISVFRKFSSILIVTIAFSLIVSLFFFPALCHIMGPEGHCGDIDHHVIKPLKDKCCLNKSLKQGAGAASFRKGKSSKNGMSKNSIVNTTRNNTSLNSTMGQRRSRIYRD